MDLVYWTASDRTSVRRKGHTMSCGTFAERWGGNAAMRVKMILPALTEAKSPFWRPIKYSLFPPLGLATLAGYLDPGDDVTIHDEHVEALDLEDTPHLVVIQVYITSAWAASMSRPCRMRRRDMLTRSSSGRGKTRGPRSWRTIGGGGPRQPIGQLRARLQDRPLSGET